jgi:tetratricopeptide (TPR) repeat protein
MTRIPKPRNRMLRMVGPLQAIFDTAAARRPPPARIFDGAIADADAWLSASARLARGLMALNFGRPHSEAEADFRAAYEIYQALGERWGMAIALASLAGLASWRGKHGAAVSHYEQALVLAIALGGREEAVQFRAQLAREFWLLGEREQAQTVLAGALHDADRVGLPELRAWVDLVAGDLARLDGEPDVARRHLDRAAELARQRSAPQFRAVMSSALGLLAALEEDLGAARVLHAEALVAARSSFDAPVIAQILIGLADLAVREADPARAAELIGASEAIRGTPDLSSVDAARVAAAARAALGSPAYDQACRRGQSATLDTLDELVGTAKRGA